jgi:hypothetical protein
VGLEALDREQEASFESAQVGAGRLEGQLAGGRECRSVAAAFGGFTQRRELPLACLAAVVGPQQRPQGFAQGQ